MVQGEAQRQADGVLLLTRVQTLAAEAQRGHIGAGARSKSGPGAAVTTAHISCVI